MITVFPVFFKLFPNTADFFITAKLMPILFSSLFFNLNLSKPSGNYSRGYELKLIMKFYTNSTYIINRVSIIVL